MSYDPSERQTIIDTVDAIVLAKCEQSIIIIDDIRTSIASLKPGKAEGRYGVLTDHKYYAWLAQPACAHIINVNYSIAC